MQSPTLPLRWSPVFFDLDGTITDSAPGITARIAASLRALGHPEPSADELIRYVGPPILEGFAKIGGLTLAEARDVLQHYRGLAALEGPYAGSRLYPGIAEVLRDINALGAPIVLATSKPESQAREILDYYELRTLFTVVCGASDDEVRSSKGDVIAEALTRLRSRGISYANAVHIGDREMDITGAAEHGLPAIFVRWGYGPDHENADAIATVSTSGELRRILGLSDADDADN